MAWIPDREPTWVDDRKDTYSVRFSYWVLVPGKDDKFTHNFQIETWREGKWLQQQTTYCRDGYLAREKVQAHIKFLTDYWTEYVHLRNDESSVRVNGVHSSIGGEDDVFKGFGGKKWKIVWLDTSRGETITTNLWHQGDIPPIFRDALPDNATFGEV